MKDGLERIYLAHVMALMALIRIMAKRSGFQKWLDEEPKITELLQDPFGYKGEPVSVYEVGIGIDETKTIAAHYLTYNRSSYDLVLGSED